MAGGGGAETQTNDPWSGQQPYLQDLFSKTQDWANKAPANTWQSDQMTQQAVGQLQQAGSAIDPYMQSIMQANQGYATGNLLDVNSNPALQGYINASNDAISRQFTENINPTIQSGAVQAGGLGGSRQAIAQGLGIDRTMEAVGRNTAGMLSNAYGQGLSATMQAQSMAPGIAKGQGMGAGLTATAGELQYGLETKDDNAARQRLMDYQALISGNFGGTQTGPEKKGPGMGTLAGGVIGGIYGGGMGGASAGAAIGSYFD